MATEALMPLQPSLASATNTRVDSSKLHLQCRVSTDDMIALTESGNDQDDVLRNKYRYCIHKDEFVVAMGRPWSKTAARKKANNAYPRVISNLGAMGGSTARANAFKKVIKYMNHFARTVQEKESIVNAFMRPENNFPDNTTYRQFPGGEEADAGEMYFNQDELQIIRQQVMPFMYEQLPMGYATTLGWAHPNTGDTMVTVMIGGIRTVMNGDFEIFTGDMVQWYWPFELDCFLRNGRRKPYLNGWQNEVEDGTLILHPPNIDPSYSPEEGAGAGVEPPSTMDAKRRKRYHDQVFGQRPDAPKIVPLIKPYVRDDIAPRMFDCVRVFGIAVTSARPHEMVDIKISRQTC